MNKNWFLSLEDKRTNNIKEFLKVLEIDFNNIIKICVSGNSSRVTTITTLKEVLNIKKFNSGVLIFSDLDKEISFKNRTIDDESFEFHLGCIKTISEENNLEIGKNEALFLAALNFFREQKAPIIIIEDAYDFVKDIDYNYYLLNDFSSEDNIYSYSKIDEKDIYLYKSELCSFAYDNIDIDALNYGSFNAYSYSLAISFLRCYYPEIKLKKIKKIIEDIKPNFIFERINKNPRVIINLANDLTDYNYSISKLKKITARDIITVSNNSSFNPNFLIKENDEIVSIIKEASIDSIILITGDKFFVNDIKKIFIN